MYKKNKVAPSTKQLTSSELQKNDKQEALRNIPLIDYMVLNAIKKSDSKTKRLPLYKEYTKEYNKYHNNEQLFTDISNEIYNITKIGWSAAIVFKDENAIGQLINYIEKNKKKPIKKYTELILKINKNKKRYIDNHKKLQVSNTAINNILSNITPEVLKDLLYNDEFMKLLLSSSNNTKNPYLNNIEAEKIGIKTNLGIPNHDGLFYKYLIAMRDKTEEPLLNRIPDTSYEFIKKWIQDKTKMKGDNFLMDGLASLYNYSFPQFTTATQAKIDNKYHIKCFCNVKNAISDEVLSRDKTGNRKEEQINENNKFNKEFNQYLESKKYNQDDWEFLTVSIKKNMNKDANVHIDKHARSVLLRFGKDDDGPFVRKCYIIDNMQNGECKEYAIKSLMETFKQNNLFTDKTEYFTHNYLPVTQKDTLNCRYISYITNHILAQIISNPMGNAINLDYFCKPSPKLLAAQQKYEECNRKIPSIGSMPDFLLDHDIQTQNRIDNDIAYDKYKKLLDEETKNKNNQFLLIYPDLHKRVQSEVTKNLHLFVTENGNGVSTNNLVKTSNIKAIYNQVTKENNNNFGPFRGSFIEI